MLLILKFRSNDLNASKGKQIEFSNYIVTEFFHFKRSEEYIDIDCYDSRKRKIRRIKSYLKLSPARGDYKIYQNFDESYDLKDFFLNDLGLNKKNNIDDFFVFQQNMNDLNQYNVFYVSQADKPSFINQMLASGETLFDL